MSPTANVSYEIDVTDRITAVCENWTAFAIANSGEHLVAPRVVGRDLWGAISDPTTRTLYRAMLKRVRADGGTASFCFRCDSPSKRRELQMHIAAHADGAVAFTTSLLCEQERSAVLLLDPAAERNEAFVVVCAWCARVRVAETQWVEVEAAARMLHLFDRTALPQLSHGICPPCGDTFTRALDEYAPRSPQNVVVGKLPPD